MLPIDRFWRLLKQYSREIQHIYIYAFFIGVTNLTLPLGIQAIINFLQAGEPTSTWIILVGFVLGGITITGILQVMQLRVVENSQQDLFARAGFEFAYRIPKITFLQLDKVHAPELTNRFIDTFTIQKGLPKILIDFSLAIFQIVFGLVLLTIYSPFFIILGFVLAFVLWLIFKITGPKGLSTSLKESKFKYNLVHWLQEIARINRSFKLYAKNNFHIKKSDDIISDYLMSRENHFQVLLSQFRLFVGFKVIVAAGLLLLGGFLVFQEQMNLGQFVAAEIIILLIINSVEKVLTTVDTIYDVLTALDKIGHVTDLNLDKDTGSAIVDSPTGLSVRAEEITFGFPDEKNKIIKQLSFNIKSNEKVVLTGKPGSGKTILLQLLSGIHHIESGELYINNIPFSNYRKESLFDNLGVSFPTNQIFEGTFLENILMGRQIDNKVVNEIVQALNLDHFLIHQPMGIDTMIDSGGRRLPRSIIQKLLIARIIIEKPKLLLLEEPLQFIEDDEKRKIVDYIMDEKQNWTVLIVSDYYYWKEKSQRVIELS